MAQLTGTYKTIADEIRAVLAKHGVEAQGIMVTDYGHGQRKIVIKSQEKIVAASGEVVTKEAADYKRFAVSEGMKVEWLGREFMYGGRMVKLTGFNITRPKNIIAFTEVATNKKFMSPKEGVIRALILSDMKVAS